jgi:peptidylprolyl isomerase
MKKYMFTLLVTGMLSTLPTFAAQDEVRAVEIANETSSKIYSQKELQNIAKTYGYHFVTNLQHLGLSKYLNDFNLGMQSRLNDENIELLSDQELEQAISAISEATLNVVSEENLQQANNFLTNNKVEEGILELEEGKLQIKVLKEGNGAVSVTEGNTPLMNFKGSLMDGTVFSDPSVGGEPQAIPLDNLLPGLKQGVIGMKEGEKRVIYIHPDLAYNTLPFFSPNTLVVFEVEVVQANVVAEKSTNNISEIDLETEEEFGSHL